MFKVGITGGIGSGKSTVCRLFETRGVPIYDTDAAAKRLMSCALKGAIVARFGEAAYHDGALNRSFLADVVFNDTKALADLNAIVHPAVGADFEAWAERQDAPYVVLESAILFESGFDAMVDKTLAVMAPIEARIERTMLRDGVSRDDVLRRMGVQLSDDELASKANYRLVNLFEEDVEPAVVLLDRKFRCDAQAN